MARWAADGSLALLAGAIVMLTGAAACRPISPTAEGPRPCGRDDVIVRGACVSGAQAARYCGDAARWDTAASICVLRACEDGKVLDEATGECLGTRSLRAIGERQHVLVDREHLLGCHEGARLRVAAGSARCVPDGPFPPLLRLPGSDAGTQSCRRGELRGTAGCVRVLYEGGRVDVAAWAGAVLGAGSTSPAAFCERATLDPAAYGLLNGQGLTVELDVALVYPNNDVTGVYARVTPTHPIPAAALGRIVAAVNGEVELLRALGGTAEVSSDARHVVCAVHAGTSPLPVRPVRPRRPAPDAAPGTGDEMP